MGGKVIITTTGGEISISVDNLNKALVVAEEINKAIQTYLYHQETGTLTPAMTTYSFYTIFGEGQPHSVSSWHYLVLASISCVCAY